MPFDEDYEQTIKSVAEIGGSAAEAYTAARTNESGEKTNVDWGKLVNSAAGALQQWQQNRTEGSRQWNDFKVSASVDESTQKTIILVVCILAGSLVFFGLKHNKK